LFCREITWEQTDDNQALNTNSTVYMEYSRDPVRTPFQWDTTLNAGFSSNVTGTWLPVHANYLTVNLAAQKGVADSTYTLYKNLIALRKDHETLQWGGFESVDLTSTLFGYRRTLADHHTIVVFVNLGAAVTANIHDLLTTDDIKDNLKATVLLANNNSTLKAGNDIANLTMVALGAYDAVIIEISSATTLAVSMLLIVCSVVRFIF